MYVKMFEQIYDGSLCTCGPWEALVTFQQLLILADPEGVVDMTAGAIARRTTIPLEIIEKGLGELLKPDSESRTPAEEGRRILPLSEHRSWGWRIVNYKHYRDLKREQDRRDYHRQYWHKRKEKLNSTQQTQPNQPRQETGDSKHEKEKKQSTRKRVTSLPPDFTISESVKSWAELKGFTSLQERLEHFRNWATAKGATYADWDAAFRNAISGDWAKLNGVQPQHKQSLADRAASDVRRGEEIFGAK